VILLVIEDSEVINESIKKLKIGRGIQELTQMMGTIDFSARNGPQQVPYFQPRIEENEFDTRDSFYGLRRVSEDFMAKIKNNQRKSILDKKRNINNRVVILGDSEEGGPNKGTLQEIQPDVIDDPSKCR